ncbi:MAG: DUF3368 domain-containing protein [Verrucomicrobia bacterium]|nr:DUF3368 domain-containing protein [Verrucomicrobiota bacterium]
MASGDSSRNRCGWATERLDILPTLTGGVFVPPAVAEEIEVGRKAGCDVPDLQTLGWISIRQPVSTPALPLAAGLGRGEASVLALALELATPVVIIDDAVGRRTAELLGIPLTGTLGLLLDAKKRDLIPAVKPLLDELDRLQFRVSPATRSAVLKLAGELR